MSLVNPLGQRQNGRHFADDTLNRIFLNENVRISIKISLKFAIKGPINNIPSLVQIMAWRQFLMLSDKWQPLETCLNKCALMCQYEVRIKTMLAASFWFLTLGDLKEILDK